MTNEKDNHFEHTNIYDIEDSVEKPIVNTKIESEKQELEADDIINFTSETTPVIKQMSRVQQRKNNKERFLTLFFASFIVLICLIVPLLSINDAIHKNITNNTLKLQMEIISAEQSLELLHETQDPMYLYQLLNNLYVIDAVLEQTEKMDNSNFSFKANAHTPSTLSEVININITHLENSLAGKSHYNESIINLLNDDFSILSDYFKNNPLQKYGVFKDITESLLLN